MQLVRHLSDLPYAQLAQGSVVTIGSYDGLHPGHRQLLDRVIAEAAEREVPSIVMSFEPTPKEFFSADAPPARLMRFREKFDALQDYGIDVFFCPKFSPAMRSITADAFIRTVLVHGFNASHIVVGDDFHFARRREGSIAELQRAAPALRYSVEQVPSVIVDGIRVSSTATSQPSIFGSIRSRITNIGE